jgi:hypothetical protein
MAEDLAQDVARLTAGAPASKEFFTLQVAPDGPTPRPIVHWTRFELKLCRAFDEPHGDDPPLVTKHSRVVRWLLSALIKVQVTGDKGHLFQVRVADH